MIHHGTKIACKLKELCARYGGGRSCPGYFFLNPFARNYCCKNFLEKLEKKK